MYGLRDEVCSLPLAPHCSIPWSLSLVTFSGGSLPQSLAPPSVCGHLLSATPIPQPGSGLPLAPGVFVELSTILAPQIYSKCNFLSSSLLKSVCPYTWSMHPGPPSPPASTRLAFLRQSPWGLPDICCPQKALPGWGDRSWSIQGLCQQEEERVG